MSIRPSFPPVDPAALERRKPSTAPTAEPLTQPDVEAPTRVGTNLLLFGLTVLCVFHAGANLSALGEERSFLADIVNPNFLARGASFAVPLLAILVTHEFGHFFAARLHRVPASFPYFLPAPGLGAGTFGAVIAMRDRIRSRNALLDIGASGPLAGLIVALPVLAWGLSLSQVSQNPPTGYVQEGQSLLYLVLKRAVVGPIPEGYDVWLHPTAFAGWWGLLLTMLNLLPWGQLDGGHIAYALFGERHHRMARLFRHGLLGLFALNLAIAVGPIVFGNSQRELSYAIASSTFWLVWYLVLGLLSKASGGAEHPPVEASELTPARRAVAWLCLALFVLLFMPTPMAFF